MLSSAVRRLSAIMFTDVVGYSTLAQQNEELALELLQQHRDLLRPIFRSFGGNEIKTIGDAFLVEFQSALQAVRCAVDIQRALGQYNGSVSEERMIQVRIGLHIGDVVFEANDVYGDGVNLASRIHAQAQPGEIVITRSVHDQIYNKIEVPVRRMGLQRLKSIQKPVELFCIDLKRKENVHFSPTAATSLAILGVVVILVAGYVFFGREPTGGNATESPLEDGQVVMAPDSTVVAPDTSIQVLEPPISNTDFEAALLKPDPASSEPKVQSEEADVLKPYKTRYASVVSSERWRDLRIALKRGTDSGRLVYYVSKDSVPVMEGTLVAVLDSSSSDATPVEAFLVYTKSRYVNLGNREEISTLDSRYYGKRVIWVRSLQ